MRRVHDIDLDAEVVERKSAGSVELARIPPTFAAVSQNEVRRAVLCQEGEDAVALAQVELGRRAANELDTPGPQLSPNRSADDA